MKNYQVRLHKKAMKQLKKLPHEVLEKFDRLALDLRDLGPYRANWPNYSKLGVGEFHCHLNRSYVACWTYEKGEIIIEVYYVGSRENAPY
jgi:mRNA-degrading endonuclease RelE of RelBE toxin-antitoxin system